MLKNNWKFVEVIGLLLILLAWGLEWRSVRKWDEADKVSWQFFTTFNQAIYTADDQANRQFQFAINRSVKQTKIDPHDPYSAYKAAWEYSEVRKLWFEQSILEIQGVGEFMKNISEISKRYGLKFPPALNKIEHSHMELLEKFKALIDPNDPRSKVSPVPQAAIVTVNKAGQLKREIKELVSASIVPLNELRRAIKQKSRSRSTYHGILFTIGSLFLIIAKIVDWWIEKKERIPNKANAADAKSRAAD